MHSSQSGPSFQASRNRVITAVANRPTGTGADLDDVTPTFDGVTPALTDETPVIGLIDLDQVADAYEQLSSAFAGETDVLHAVACKAVPLQPMLRFYAESGAGCEVASPGELELALTAGFAPESIVFDSPAKTLSELRRAVSLGVSMNIDNFDELERLDTLLDGTGPSATAHRGSEAASARMGIRINPQSGTGRIGALSTATQTSKFGIGVADSGAREAVIEAYLARPWLNQIHVHSGSQGIGLDQAAAGIDVVVELAKEINARAADDVRGAERNAEPSQAQSRDRQITRIDIGGGLPVNFAGEDVTPTFAEYRAVLEEQVPDLFDFDIITEFGRALLAKAGTILTHVEYAKTTGGRRIAMTHAGVQVATRTAYAPDDWPLRILPFDPDGNPKTAEAVPTDVAGPACFAGDLLARDRMLPRLDAGDIVAVPDTGAYYFSNPFSYNLLPRVPVYGYRVQPAAVGADEAEADVGADARSRLGDDADPLLDEGRLEFSIIRRGQTLAEVLAEAGGAEIAQFHPMQSRFHPVQSR
ncbi:diaminopimelate decarboxylase [Brevibacterium marinum]|uniref:Diaminopimelate decarboxylase n=1 Tax=Brevibacterium marinum TaxID=418643 RepID=A0A846S3R6_9MICO|nr:diaminopimelate decarboxylase [Brevibacterium marinum]NJC56152.1 diaminopimelate decarboxylase [Brevibacterium marinum]